MAVIQVKDLNGKVIGYLGTEEQVQPNKRFTEEILKHNRFYFVEVRITEYALEYIMGHKPVGTVLRTYWMRERDDLGRPCPPDNNSANLINGQWYYPTRRQVYPHCPIEM